MKRSWFYLPAVLLFVAAAAVAQPVKVAEGVKFTYSDDAAQAVSLVGDFNSWSTEAHRMSKEGSGTWSLVVDLLPGSYQYAFSVDGKRISVDPNNPVTFESIDGTRLNSLVTLSTDGRLVVEGYPVRKPLDDAYTSAGGTVYLNLVFKHHLPMFYSAATDNIAVPFVRQHATRDYFELADVIQRYTNVHATVVLSPTLLWQIEEVYVRRLAPFIKKYRANNPKAAEMDAAGFLARMKGKTDPWIDICLTPAERLTEQDKAFLYKNKVNAFTMSPVRLHRFPELLTLYEKWRDANGNPSYTVEELRLLKFFAVFANFDSEFYERRVPLIQTGTRIYRSLDLRDLISFRSDGKYYLKHAITEVECQRAVASAYYIMASILPAFQKAQFSPRAMVGQLEFAATSFSDAPLPLILDSDVAREANPQATLPEAFRSPADAATGLAMAKDAYLRYLNLTPVGYVGPMGAISPATVPVLRDAGFDWFLSSSSVLAKSEPANMPTTLPYKVTVDGKTITGAFSDGLLTSRINWVYRNYYAENSADDFVRQLMAMAPGNGKKHSLVTVVIDNDEAWMHYQRDIDGKGFINGLYRKLHKMYERPDRPIVAVTMSEYIAGNRLRGVPPHQPADLDAISTLASGTRVNGTFDPWIGTPETNEAWTMLRQTRQALGSVTAPSDTTWMDNLAKQPVALFQGAMSPDWFKALNRDYVGLLPPKPFETRFLGLLGESCEKAGVAKPAGVKPFIDEGTYQPDWTAPRKRTIVTFQVKLVDREAITSVFIAGSRKELANMEPNTVRMWDNGENGDKVFGDDVWTIVVEMDEGELLYKYSNSGGQGTWDGSEAFPEVWRKVRIEGEKMTIDDVFARIKSN